MAKCLLCSRCHRSNVVQLLRSDGASPVVIADQTGDEDATMVDGPDPATAGEPGVWTWPSPVGRLSLHFLCQAAAFLMPAAAILLVFGSTSRAPPHCGGVEVKQAIVGLFKRQLGLTPYARFIDVAQADVSIEAIFDVTAEAQAASCVAFATYDARFNEVGRNVPGRERLQHSLLDELSGEKQVFYTVKLTTDGRPAVHVRRISG